MTEGADWRQQFLLHFAPKPMFTQDQIQFIEQLVDKRVQTLLSRPAAHQQRQKAKDYHTADEIRQLIIDNLPHLRKTLLISPRLLSFSIDYLRHELAQLTKLREGDLALLGGGGYRWYRQVYNSLGDWPECPFVRISSGWYEFKEVQS